MLLVNPVLEKAFIIKYLSVYPSFPHMVKIIIFYIIIIRNPTYEDTGIRCNR